MPKVELKVVGKIFENGTFVIIGSGEYNIDVLVAHANLLNPRTDVIAHWLKQGITGVISGISFDIF